MSKSAALILGFGIYIGLSLLCLVKPELLPVHSMGDAILVGPPVFFVWGAGAWPWFAFFTAILGILLVIGIRDPRHGAKLAVLAVFVWCIAGAVSALFSI